MMSIFDFTKVVAASVVFFSMQTALADLYSAIHNCAQESGGLKKMRIGGTSKTAVGLSCQGPTAQSLYESVRFYSNEGRPKQDDTGWVRATRFFGHQVPMSQCRHSIQTPDGRSTSTFGCKLKIDITDDTMGSNLFDEMQACALAAGQLKKTRIQGTSSTAASLVCAGEVARRLFDQSLHYATESGPKVTDTNNVTISRYFGNSSLPSQCIRQIRDAYGKSVNRHTCYLTIDLTDDVLRAF